MRKSLTKDTERLDGVLQYILVAELVHLAVILFAVGYSLGAATS
jgi:hypothetical protein